MITAKRATTIGLVTVGLLAGAWTAQAQPIPNRAPGVAANPGWPPGTYILQWARGLNLSDAQATELAKLETRFLPALIELDEETIQLRNEMARLRYSPQPAWDGLTAARRALAEARSDHRQLRDELHRAVLALLSPEQRSQLWASGCGGWAGGGRGRGAGWGRGWGRGRGGGWGPGGGGGYGLGGGWGRRRAW